MHCPLCHTPITFWQGIKTGHPFRVACIECKVPFRIHAPGQTAVLAAFLTVFLLASAGVGFAFEDNLWFGLACLGGLAVLWLVIEAAIYRYYDRKATLTPISP